MNPVYLDYAATAPLRPEVLESMLPLLQGVHGNPSGMHAFGRRARAALDGARERFAAVIGAAPSEVVFTRGGTEADNMAVLGRSGVHPTAPVACSAIEHRAVLEGVRSLEARRIPTHLIAVDAQGVVRPEMLHRALSEKPAVVSVMWANNETGVLQPIATLAEQVADEGVPLHSDAVQALGKVPVRVDRIPVALLSFSAHKLGGPRGVGVLWVRRGTKLAPLLHGGGQERGLRPGTEDVAGAIGCAVAAELAERERETETARLTALRDRLEGELRSRIPDLVVNAAGAERLPNICHVSVPGGNREVLLMALDIEGIAASAGSACSSGSLRGSHVLEAMGVPAEIAAGSVRFSLGKHTTEADIDRAAAAFASVVARCGALA